MPDSFANFLIRRDAEATPMSQTTINLLIGLLVVLLLALFLAAGLLFLRARRRARKQQSLPMYEEKRLSTSTTSSHRRVMARATEAVYVCQEKQDLIDSTNSPPQSPLPEIHITFPEEFDDAGKRKSGRVVVVRVGDTGVGLEPADDLPAYQQNEADRFHSIDLERVGGLVEKARNAPNKEYD